MKKNTIRLIQKHITTLQKNVFYKISGLQNGGKIVLGGAIISFLSLLLPWLKFSPSGSLDDISSKISGTHSFSALIGYSGFFVASAILICMFFLFSQSKKDKLHSLTSFSYKIHNIIFLMSIFIFYTSIHSILVILGLQTFTQNVSYDSGVILAITGSIIILIGSVQIKRDTKKNTAGVYLNKQQDSEQRNIQGHQEEVKNNMKLPF